MFTIQSSDGTYFHNKGRIILFETQEEANYFMNLFSDYSMQRLAQEGRGMDIVKVPMSLQSCTIKLVSFNVDKVECGTVLMRELFDNR